MSVDVVSLPAWKLALLERKRRGDVDSEEDLSKAGGGETLGDVPPWKQEILFRKQQKRHSTGRTYDSLDGANRRSLSEILLSPDDAGRCTRSVEPWPGLLSPVRDTGYFVDPKPTGRLNNSSADHTSASELVDVPVEEERLPPVHQNPILLLDLEKRQQSGFVVGLSSPVASDSQQNSGLPLKLLKLRVNSREALDVDSNEHIECPTSQARDEVVQEDEVLYGKGFVSRLLQRFSYLSGKEDQSIAPSQPSFFRSLIRGQSSEDFAIRCCGPEVRWKKKYPVRKKACSLDDLLADNTSERCAVENGSVGKGQDSWEGSSEVGIVLNAKSIFEGLVTSPTSMKDPPFHIRQKISAKPVPEAQPVQRSGENCKDPNWNVTPDDTLPHPTKCRSNASLIAHHPPAILGPKPVYTGHVTSLQSTEHQLKRRLDAQNSRDLTLGEDAAEKAKYCAQTSSAATNQVTDDQTCKAVNDCKDVGSTSKFKSLLDSNESTDLLCDSKNREDQLNISGHIQEHSKVTNHVLGAGSAKTLEPVTGNVKMYEPTSGNAKMHEPVAGNVKMHEPMASIAKMYGPVVENAEMHESITENLMVKSKTHETMAGSVKVHKEANVTAPKKTGPSRPGLLLIRPASNLTTTRTEHLQMTKYNDITKGEFAPAKHPIHKPGGSEDDDESDADQVDGAANRSKYLKIQYEFEGGGVRVGRSLLAKTKQAIQLKISFDDTATSTYEYPSEQSLIDSMPPEPGDADYPTGEQNGKALPSPPVVQPNCSSADSGPAAAEASSRSSSVDLSSYRSKTQVDFAFDACSNTHDQVTLAPPAGPQSDLEVAASQSDNAIPWSDSTLSDHVLF